METATQEVEQVERTGMERLEDRRDKFIEQAKIIGKGGCAAPEVRKLMREAQFVQDIIDAIKGT